MTTQNICLPVKFEIRATYALDDKGQQQKFYMAVASLMDFELASTRQTYKSAAAAIRACKEKIRENI